MKIIALRSILMFFITALFWGSCSDSKKSNSVYFKPKAQESKLTDHERQMAIQAKRAELLSLDSLLFDNNIKLSILVPKPTEKITENVSSYALSKMIKILTQNGVGCVSGDPIFALAMTMTPLNEGMTTTIPQQSYTNYDINLYVGNMITGDMYGSCRMEIMGIGNSPEATAINAISSISNNTEIQMMIKTSSEKIISWYNKNSRTFISLVESLVALNKYSQALCLLKSAPQEAEVCFTYAEQQIGVISKKLLEQNASKNLEALKHAIAIGGKQYNPDAYAYLNMIPIDCKEKVEGETIFDAYVENLKQEEKEALDHQRFIEKEQLACQKLELQLQIETNQAMIEKYRIDSTTSQSNYEEPSGFSLASLIGETFGGGPFMSILGEVVQIGATEMLNFLI